MLKRIVTGIMLILLLASMLTLTFDIQPVEAVLKTIVVPDDFLTIQLAIDNANPGDTIYVRAGTYNERLLTSKSLTIIGEDKSNTIVDGGGWGLHPVIEILADNVAVSRLTIRNAGYSDNPWRGSCVLIRDGRKSCIINDNVISDGYFGITVGLSLNNVVRGNTISKTEWGLNLYGSYDNIIEGNTISNSSQSDPYWGGGIYLDHSNDNTITDNMISNVTEHGIFHDYSSHNTVVGNIISRNTEIEIQDSIGIYFGDYSYDNTVLGNYISKSHRGIYAGQLAYNNTISGNTITNLTIYACGINIWGPNNTIADNTITNMGYVGIQLNSVSSDGLYGVPNACANNVVSGNSISNSTFGINLILAAFSNTIAGNNVSDNGLGILLSDNSDNNTVINNFVSNNDYGILIFSSNNTKIYHNNFIDNTDQTLLSEAINTTWDDGYPSGGNYWSNYADVDSYSGLYQNGTGSDGIWDHPYVIDESNRDNYPFTPSQDIAIVSVMPSLTKAYVGRTVNITVTVQNEGNFTKSFEVTCKYILESVEHTIGTQIVSNLPPNTNTTLTFTWTTTDITVHTIKAEATILPGETDTTDNILISPITVKVTILGDVNGDGVINILDLVAAANAFGAVPGSWAWDPQADVYPDNRVNIFDLVAIALRFGQRC